MPMLDPLNLNDLSGVSPAGAIMTIMRKRRIGIRNRYTEPEKNGES